MYFPDLTPYTYGQTPADPNILNVGWLSREHGYPRAKPAANLLMALKQLVQKPVNLYRGTHWCEFCPAPIMEKTGTTFRIVDQAPNCTGNGEIRVSGRDGCVYVAPVLIGHYVAVHEYAPPQVFIDACLKQLSQCQDDA